MSDVVDLERRIVTTLDRYRPSPDLADRIARRVDQRARHRMQARKATVVVSVAAVAAAVVGVRLVGGGSGRTVAADGAMALLRWEEVPGAPIPPRDEPAMVWTGSELVVWGGHAPGGDPSGTKDDGAAYDPSTRTWRKLPDGPLGPRSSMIGVWTGTEVLLWGGWSSDAPAPPPPETRSEDGRVTVSGRISISPGGTHGYADGAAYNPATDTWRSIPEAPIDSRIGEGVAWTGSEMLVIGGVSTPSEGEDGPIGAAYDPATDTWRSLPDLGVGAALMGAGWTGITAAWTGDKVLYLRPSGVDGPRLFAYDPAADAWEERSRPGQRFHLVWDNASPVWTGQRLVLASGTYDAGSDPWSVFEAIDYDPTTDEWGQVAMDDSHEAMLFTPYSMGAWNGREVVFLTTTGSFASALDPSSGRWVAIPEPPRPPREDVAPPSTHPSNAMQLGFGTPTMVRVGDDVYVWEMGWIYRLTREPEPGRR